MVREGMCKSTCLPQRSCWKLCILLERNGKNKVYGVKTLFEIFFLGKLLTLTLNILIYEMDIGILTLQDSSENWRH